MGLQVRFEAPDSDKIAEALFAAADGALLKKAADRLKDTGDELREKVRDGIRKIPSWNLYGTGLRARMMANVEVRPLISTSHRVGIRIVMNPYGLGPAKAMDTNKRRAVPGHGVTYAFRHPVFGNRGVWVNQGGYPYFRTNLRRQRKITDEAIKKALEEVTQELVRKSR